MFTNLPTDALNVINTDFLCSVYPATTKPLSATTWQQLDDKTALIAANLMTQGRACIVIKDTDYTDPATFKSAMSGQNIVYPLATPQTYQLTPTEVKTLLGDNNIFADCGDVAIEYETGTVAVALADLYEKLAAQIGE